MNRFSLTPTTIVLLVLAPATTLAGPLLDYIREYDLNDYSLGLSVGASQSPYLGADNSMSAYPILTSFTHSSFTDNWLFLQGENMGFRYVTDSDWEVGLIGRVQMLGAGVSRSNDLLGQPERKATVEMGPMIGWRALPVHVQLRTYQDALNRHSGATSELEFRLPRKTGRGYVVPSVSVTYMSNRYSNYHFEVSADDATAALPEYEPGAAVNLAANVALGYELSPRWLLVTSIGVEFLDAVIEQSPITNRSHLWSGSISLAYNADVFRARDYSGPDKNQDIGIRLGAFNSNAHTKLLLDRNSAQPGDNLDLEDFLGISDRETIAQLDAYYRMAYYHRLDIGYFGLRRNAATTLPRDMWFGDAFYAEGTDIEFHSDSQVLRLSYAYSLMRDGQKELAVSGGLSYMQFESEVGSTNDPQQTDRVRIETLLPTIGISGSAPLGRNWQLGIDIDLFALQFDNYDGHMTYLSADLERKFNESFGAGLGYNFYDMRLTSTTDTLDGILRTRYHGPKIYFVMRF